MQRSCSDCKNNTPTSSECGTCCEWGVAYLNWEPKDLCIECGNSATYIRYTQFSGTHPFCETHAREESDFGVSDSYEYWKKLGEKSGD